MVQVTSYNFPQPWFSFSYRLFPVSLLGIGPNLSFQVLSPSGMKWMVSIIALPVTASWPVFKVQSHNPQELINKVYMDLELERRTKDLGVRATYIQWHRIWEKLVSLQLGSSFLGKINDLRNQYTFLLPKLN